VTTGPWADVWAAKAKFERLDARLAQVDERLEQNARLVTEVLAGDCTVADALARQAEQDLAEPWHLRRLRGRYPGCSDAECSALHFFFSVFLRDPDERADVRARTWADAYASHFGTAM